MSTSATINSHLLDGVYQENLGEILSLAETRQITAKQILVNRGEKAEHLFLLRRGNVRYFRTTKKGEEIIFRWLVPGDTFGLGSLLKDPPPYIGTAEAITDGEVMVWSHANIRKLAAQYPQLGENTLKIVLEYLKNYADRHVRLVSKSAEDRLADVLLILEHQRGRLDNGKIELQITNEQLSALADISPFTASRLLNKWQRKGTVSKRRAKLTIHVPEALVTD
jgi:CRP/FNR family transcriptional regulator, nitrogen oxide reductase regulator